MGCFYSFWSYINFVQGFKLTPLAKGVVLTPWKLLYLELPDSIASFFKNGRSQPFSGPEFEMHICHNIPKILEETSDFTAARRSLLLEDGIQGLKNANLALYLMETRGKALISQYFIEVTDCFTQIKYNNFTATNNGKNNLFKCWTMFPINNE